MSGLKDTLVNNPALPLSPLGASQSLGPLRKGAGAIAGTAHFVPISREPDHHPAIRDERRGEKGTA